MKSKVATAVFCFTALCWPVMAQSNSPLQNIIGVIQQNGKVLPAGIGANLHGRVGEAMCQQFDVIGGGSTNLWRVGAVHETFLGQAVNREKLGLGFTYEVRKAPQWLKHLLLVSTLPREFQFGVSVTENVEVFDHTNHYDWKETTGNVVGGWSF